MTGRKLEAVIRVLKASFLLSLREAFPEAGPPMSAVEPQRLELGFIPVCARLVGSASAHFDFSLLMSVPPARSGCMAVRLAGRFFQGVQPNLPGSLLGTSQRLLSSW